MAGFIQAPTSPAPDAKALEETEQINAVIGRCVNVISEDAASVPLRLFDISNPGRPKEISDHPAIVLWRHINPVESPVVFKQQVFADLLCEGNHFAWLDKDNAGVPRSMIRIPPEQVKVEPDPQRIIGGYTWKRADGVKKFYSADEIMHIRTRNPNPIYRGLGLLVRARDQIRFDFQLRSFKENQIKNGVPTSLVFTVKRMFSNEQEWERFRQETWDRLRGIQNAGKPMFIRADDVDVKVIDRPKEDEVAFINSLKYTRNEFAMLFGVPPSRLSDYSESFRANASEQGRTYWQDTIMSWHQLFIDYLNSTFIPRWFPAEVDQRTLIPRIAYAFDYSQVRALALSMRDMATVNEILIRNAMRSPADATVSLGDARPEDPKADQLYMNGRPLGDPGPEAVPGSQPSGGEIRPEGDTDPEEESRAAVGQCEGQLGPGLGGPPRPSLRAVPGDIIDEDKEAKRMAAEVDELIKKMVERAALEEIEIAGILGSFDSKDPAVLEAVRVQSVLVSEAVTNTTAIEVRRALALAIESGYDPDQMRKSIHTVFRSARADWRLDRVARTESHQAHEAGGYHGLRQNGVRRKEWVSTADGEVRNDLRSDHVHLNGTVKEIDDPFIDPTSGALLMYPGDTAGARSPADVVNCRCIKVANFSDLEENSFHRAIDRKSAWHLKQATRRRFEGAFKTETRRFLQGMEERAIEELNRQIGEKKSLPLAAGRVAL